MIYADKTFYRNTYIGRPCATDTTLEKWLARASDDIDIYTFNGVIVDDLTATDLTWLKKATCAQAEDYVINGEGSESFASVSIGSFSMAKGDAESSKAAGGLCENALRYLSLTGLAYRGVRVCSRSRA